MRLAADLIGFSSNVNSALVVYIIIVGVVYAALVRKFMIAARNAASRRLRAA